jgi:glutamate synthase domain-containing protein 3
VHKDARIERLDAAGEEALRALLERHHRATGSHRAEALLDGWETAKRRFARVVPAI